MNAFLPKQTPSTSRDLAAVAPAYQAAGVQASGWLDLLKNAALGAIKGATGA